MQKVKMPVKAMITDDHKYVVNCVAVICEINLFFMGEVKRPWVQMRYIANNSLGKDIFTT